MTYLTQAPNSIVVLHGQQSETYVRALRAPSKPKAHTVADAINQWLDYLRGSATRTTCRQNRLFISAFARDQRIESKPLSSVTEANVNAWVNEGVKLGSRRVRLAIVRSFFKFAAIRQLLTTPNPSLLARVDLQEMSHEDKESRLVQPFSDVDFKLLTADLDARIAECGDLIGQHERKKNLEFWRAAVVISRCAGLRMGDICSLETASFRTGEMIVWSRKRGRRVAPHILDREQFESVTVQFRDSKAKYCFPEIREVYQNPSTRCSLNAQFRRMCERAGCESATFHSLRHAFATECLRQGFEMEHIAKSLGHLSMETTKIYTDH